MVRLMRHRQTKGPETARSDLNYRATSRLYPHFGWTFGIVSFTLLGFSLLHFYSKLIRDGELSRLNSHEGWRTLIVCCVLFGAGLVFAMAWWTTRKARQPKRAWGIAASLLSLALPLYVYIAGKPMRISDWEIMAYGALALFIYGWPDRRLRHD
jgi:cell division protein FtsW (lipid II flippase)